MNDFTIKDSGVREEFDSGMVRDTEDGKTDYTTIMNGPMFKRWAEHLTRGAKKYPNSEDGTPNWMKAAGPKELERFRRSVFRHFIAWWDGDQDEDHVAALFFNLNGIEYVKEKMKHAFDLPIGENLSSRTRPSEPQDFL